MIILSPIPKQFLDESGVPYTDGTVSIYLHGDTEFAEVYADAEGTALIENPCILDSHGMWQGFVDSDKPLDYIVKDSEGNVITRFCNISLPTGDDIPGVKVISSDGSINVSETLENGERTFDITVNDDMFKPSCAKFSHEAVNGGGQVSFDSFELEGDPDRDIYLTDGVITFAKGAYHISANLVIGNDECHNEYFGITANFGDCSTAKVWDRSFVHEESVEIGLDIVADIDGYTVVPTIVELPDDMHCSISRLYIHKVSGAGVGGSMASVEHDGTLVGDGTHNDPLGVKDWSEIRTTLENTANELLDHEVSPSAHQDIRDDIEYEANRAQAAEDLKADKVQGATAGNLAALDASGNLTDSGSKVADFKTKQTPVTDPSASGAGLEFIDSISQDANGEITPHKKSVQDGTTAQKGVVQLQDSIGSTESSTDKAVTPHAVREAINAAVSSAYHAAGTKSVAQLTSSLLVAKNEGCVYNITDSGTTTSDFVDGAGHPINAGDNVGVCDVGGGVYKFDLLSGFVDLTNYLTKTGDASNATSTFTKASGDTSTMTSGGKLSVLFTAISSFFASVASALGGKADKASDATNGDFAALDSNGNLTDSGKKAADFAVSSVYNETDPKHMISSIFIHGTGTSFYKKIATMMESPSAGNASFVLIRGFVGSWISSQENTEFELLVRNRVNLLMDAFVAKKYGKNPFTEIDFELYEEANNTFSLWVKNSNSYTTGNFSVAAYDGTSIVYDGTDGTPTGTLVASASQNYKLMMVTDGDGSNTTSNFTKASGDTSTMASGGKLSAIFTAISSFFASLKALAFKDKASYNDLSSGVQSSLDKADSALQAHQSVTDNNPTLAWGTTSKVGKVGSTDLRVTMPSNPAQNLPASVITSGTFDTDRIADDAITAAKVKDNETLLVNIRGSASQLSHVTSQNEASTWRQIAKLESSDANRVMAQGFVVAVRERVNTSVYYTGTYIVSCTSKGSDCKILQGTRLANSYDMNFVVAVDSNSITLYANSGLYSPYHVTALFGNPTIAIGNALGSKPAGADVAKTFLLDTSGQVGSTTTPVYVDSNGQVQPCTQGATLKSNTATLYIAGYTDNNIPIYNVKDIKNGCVNHVDFSNIASANCNITFEAPTLAAGEEYDYVISLEGYTNNTGVSTGSYVENCKQVLRYDYNSNIWVGEGLFLQATDWRQICIVRGNTCEWKRVALS